MNNSRMNLTGSSSQWKMGSFLGNAVYIQPMFLILIAIIAFSGINSYGDLLAGLLLVPLLIFSVLFHELAHATMSKIFGYGSSTIILHGFGGVAINDTRTYRTPLKSSAISAAGPISSAFLALVGYLFAIYVLPILALQGTSGYVVAQATSTFVSLNLILAIFNALPILPMDGGNVLMYVLQHFLKNEYKALKYATYTSIATLILVAIPLFLYFRPGLFTILIFGMLLFQNISTLRNL